MDVATHYSPSGKNAAKNRSVFRDLFVLFCYVEQVETIDQSREAVIHETADLWFHTMVMLSHLDLEPRKVLEELEKRFNISGLEEKAARQN